MGKIVSKHSGIFLVSLAAFTLSGFQCSLPLGKKQTGELRIVSYNVHNLFDCNDDGTEYPEYQSGSGTWNEEKYQKRLESAAVAIRSLYPGQDGPDILCLQEVENRQVLDDLADGALKACGYRWRVVGGPEDSPVKCALLSRVPIKSVKAHTVSDAWGFGRGRDILEVVFDLEGLATGQRKAPSREKTQSQRGEEGAHSRSDELTLFLCHWKSRKEGTRETEVARVEAARLIDARIKELEETDGARAIVVCGDFNESPDEFERTGRAYRTAFMPPREVEPEGEEPTIPDEWHRGCFHVAFTSDTVVRGTLFSPWGGSDGFSYIFDGKPERLDGFLLNDVLVDGKGLDYGEFKPGDSGDLFDGNGGILCWDGTKGFSDHLPIALSLRWLGGQ